MVGQEKIANVTSTREPIVHPFVWVQFILLKRKSFSVAKFSINLGSCKIFVELWNKSEYGVTNYVYGNRLVFWNTVMQVMSIVSSNEMLVSSDWTLTAREGSYI